jgi:hypothetical protein
VITKRSCPHTGIVNFFSPTDPLLAVGSVSRATNPFHYVWRSYLDDRQCGVATDIAAAEAHLREAIGRRPDLKPDMI